MLPSSCDLGVIHLSRFQRAGMEYIISSEGFGVYVVKSEGEEVARAEVARDGAADYLSDVYVVPCHQRRGVASALYAVIERDLGTHLRANPSPKTSPEERKFWRKREERRSRYEGEQ